MEKKIETRKKIVKAVVMVVIIAGLMLTAHILVNDIDWAGIARAVHGG